MKKLFLSLLIAASCPVFAQEILTVSDVTRGAYRFYSETFDDITPLSDGESYVALKDGNIVKCSFATGEIIETIKKGFYYGFEMSPTEDKILYYSIYEPIHRNSFNTKYYVYDLETKQSKPLLESAWQQQATFSPDGKKVAFVVDNNIMLKDLESGDISSVTTDGKINSILNGIPDWVYEEEFSFNRAFEFSPDSKKIAYIKFNETDVKEYVLQFYNQLSSNYDPESLYPINYSYKYPKVGENNSKVSVHVFDFEAKTTSNVNIGNNADIYVPNIQWTNNPEILAIVKMNRKQNHLGLITYNTKDESTKTIYTQSDKYYIEETVPQSFVFLSDNKSFLVESEQSGYRHIYRYGMDGKLINAVTSGEKELTELCGVDEKNKKVYYIGVGKNPTQTALYCTDLAGKKTKCLSQNDGTNEAVFSSTFKYYVNTYSNGTTPAIITVNTSDGKVIKTLETNEKVKKAAESYGGINHEIFFWKNSHGDQLSAYMIKPTDFDSTKRYPVLVVGYNGPNYNFVNDEWEFGWHQLLAQKGYIVAATDTRGTGRKGSDFRKCTYGKLGALETEDLSDFADYLGSQAYIDGNRLGIWGWSYGGFMVANAMTRTPGKYALGVAVAPVTNWEFYDNIYTERYMGLPTDNHEGYINNSPISYAHQLKGKFLLIFGSADDNVHPQNSMMFAEALVQANKQFDYMQYTNRNHSIYGGNTRLHLYTKMTEFILNNL